jgi:hypothetical protein
MQQWKLFMYHWQSYNESNKSTEAHCFHMNEVFANCSKEDKMYPLTTVEIAEAYWANATLMHLFKCNTVIDQGLEIKSLRTLLVSAKIIGWLSSTHSKCVQSNGITTTYSTLDTQVWKRQ